MIERGFGMEIIKELPHFKGWKNVEEGYFTKTKLKTEMGLKPIDESKYDATATLYINSKWGEYVLYHVDNCVEIKKRKVIEHKITPKTIAEALYIINKSAKVSRDTKSQNYEIRKYQVVNAAKTRQIRLYDLKEATIQKLLTQGIIEVVGFHMINNKPYKLLQLEGFTFHTPIGHIEKDNLEFLGSLEGANSSEKTKQVTLNFFEAENLLNRFVNESLD